MNKVDPRERRNFDDRRKVERREPKRGSTIRIDDPDGHRPKRVKRADYDRKRASITTEKE